MRSCFPRLEKNSSDIPRMHRSSAQVKRADPTLCFFSLPEKCLAFLYDYFPWLFAELSQSSSRVGLWMAWLKGDDVWSSRTIFSRNFPMASPPEPAFSGHLSLRITKILAKRGEKKFVWCLRWKRKADACTLHFYSGRRCQVMAWLTGTRISTHEQEGWHHLIPEEFCACDVSFVRKKYEAYYILNPSRTCQNVYPSNIVFISYDTYMFQPEHAVMLPQLAVPGSGVPVSGVV